MPCQGRTLCALPMTANDSERVMRRGRRLAQVGNYNDKLAAVLHFAYYSGKSAAAAAVREATAAASLRLDLHRETSSPDMQQQQLPTKLCQ